MTVIPVCALLYYLHFKNFSLSLGQFLQRHGAPKKKIDTKAIIVNLVLYFVVQNAFALHET